MLKELVISDFAIIGRLELSLGPGLSCLTGETGAGKSILVDAIAVALGGRAAPELVRAGRDGSVEAAFDISGMPGLRARLEALGLDKGDDLIIRRILATSGRGRVYVNGSLSSLSTLQEIGEGLVDIHGQHEHQSLLRVDAHMGLLDSYCSLTEKADGCRAVYARFMEGKKRAETLKALAKGRADRLDLLMFQGREIDEAALAPGEEEALGVERGRLLHADRLKSLSEAARDGLKDREGSALSIIGQAVKAAREIVSLAPEMADCLRLLESAHVSVDEACSYLRDFGGSLEADPGRLSEIEGRLDAIGRLKKKYGGSIEDALRYREAIGKEVLSIEDSEDESARLDSLIAGLEAEVLERGRALSEARREGARGFCRGMEAELAGLGMAKARFEVRFDDLPAPGPGGLERAEFMFSANPGEPPRPLARIASGGELSRVMLALKVILAHADGVPTLIFDEVDSGVGGATAGAVGRKLREASAGRQVLCATPLPQVASLAEEHYAVLKDVQGQTTSVRVRRLNKEERVKEIARMLGGGEGSLTASAHAEELVRRGESDGQA